MDAATDPVEIAVESMEDPSNASKVQIEAFEALAGLMDDVTNDLQDIEPSPELASAHGDFVAAFQNMIEGVDQLIEGLEDENTSAVLVAFETASTVGHRGDAAQDVLEEALGFSITSVD